MPDTRLDFMIEEAGCLIWIAPRSLGGLTPSEFSSAWMGEADETVQDLVERGAIVPLGLYQDDGYLVRFVLGDLTNQEASEWTARAVARVEVPCGEAIVSGILTPDFESDFDEIAPADANGSYFEGAYVEVPAGDYRVEVYAYPPGDLAGGWGRITNRSTFGRHPGIEPEKALDYFRRTRPDEEPPAWIRDEDDGEGLYVDFLIRLVPMAQGEAAPAIEFDEDGGIAWEFRKPEVCPVGIRSEFE